jgi:hypothetical protein
MEERVGIPEKSDALIRRACRSPFHLASRAFHMRLKIMAYVLNYFLRR